MKELKELFARYVNDECTEAEIKFLLQHVREAKNEIMLKEVISRILAESDLSEQQDSKDLDERISKVYGRIKHKIEEAEPEEILKSTSNRWYLSAAAIFVLFAIGLYFIKGKNPAPALADKTVEKIKERQVDVVPGSNRATLILANGKEIVLDHAQAGILASENEVEISKANDGELIYASVGALREDTKPEINTLNIPRGGEYQITLADGTKVWLNAASSLSFPSSFQGNERRVELAGEAYFEVAKNAKMPFRVISKGQSIEVLGTHFNVSAYEDESTVKTTLLEGSIRVTENSRQQSSLLKPGQQAIVKNGIDVISVDTKNVIAWKDGLISFKSADLKSIMRQISRWYDVSVQYSGDIPTRSFTGKISRNSNLSEILKVLERSQINFKMSGRKLIVMP
jgi:hypothetical protein